VISSGSLAGKSTGAEGSSEVSSESRGEEMR